MKYKGINLIGDSQGNIIIDKILIKQKSSELNHSIILRNKENILSEINVLNDEKSLEQKVTQIKANPNNIMEIAISSKNKLLQVWDINLDKTSK